MADNDDNTEENPGENPEDDLLDGELLDDQTADETSEPVSGDTDQTDARLGRLEQDLSLWAERNRVTTDPYVTGIRDAIRRRDNLTAYATSNPLDFLPHPNQRGNQNLDTLSRVLAITRNILVFLPVALTWYAINKATTSFGQYARLAPEDSAELSFLQFWQSGGPRDLAGFAPLSSSWRIAEVASKVVLIIALVIALTAVIGIIDQITQRREIAGQRSIDNERTAIAVKIMTALQGNKSIDSQTLEETLALVLNNLGEAARDVNTAAARLETSTVGVAGLTPKIEELTGHIDQLASKFSTELQDGITGLTNAVGILGTNLEGDLQRLMNDVINGLEDVTDRLKSTSATVEFGTKQLRDDLDAIHQRLTDIPGLR